MTTVTNIKVEATWNEIEYFWNIKTVLMNSNDTHGLSCNC